jgi:hypothetical protein
MRDGERPRTVRRITIAEIAKPLRLRTNVPSGEIAIQHVAVCSGARLLFISRLEHRTWAVLVSIRKQLEAFESVVIPYRRLIRGAANVDEGEPRSL